MRIVGRTVVSADLMRQVEEENRLAAQERRKKALESRSERLKAAQEEAAKGARGKGAGTAPAPDPYRFARWMKFFLKAYVVYVIFQLVKVGVQIRMGVDWKGSPSGRASSSSSGGVIPIPGLDGSGRSLPDGFTRAGDEGAEDRKPLQRNPDAFPDPAPEQWSQLAPMYRRNAVFDMYVYLSNDKYFQDFNDSRSLVWLERDIKLGDSSEGSVRAAPVINLRAGDWGLGLANGNKSLYIHTFFGRVSDEGFRFSVDPTSVHFSPYRAFSRSRELTRFYRTPKTYKVRKLLGTEAGEEEGKEEAGDSGKVGGAGQGGEGALQANRRTCEVDGTCAAPGSESTGDEACAAQGGEGGGEGLCTVAQRAEGEGAAGGEGSGEAGVEAGGVEGRIDADVHDAAASAAGAMGADDDGEDGRPFVGVLKGNMTVTIVNDFSGYDPRKIPPSVRPQMEINWRVGRYNPIVHFDDFWILRDQETVLDGSITADTLIPLRLGFSSISVFNWQLQIHLGEKLHRQAAMGFIAGERGVDDLKRVIVDSNPYYLGLTIVVSMLHTVFDFLAFKNDIQHWRNMKSFEGLSIKSLFNSAFMNGVIFLYLLDNDASFIILISCGLNLFIDLWKMSRAFVTSVTWSKGRISLPSLSFSERNESYSKGGTKEIDEVAMKWLYRAVGPLVGLYALYSVVYVEHKGWYSFCLTTLVSAIYLLGFLAMLPQLFINYKLRSTAHLPWRQMTYKFLNTIIDDLFAFLIKMPTLHRLSVFRDDLVFLAFLYQKWAYGTDMARANEYGYVEKQEPKKKLAAKGGGKKVPIRDTVKSQQSAQTPVKDKGAGTGLNADEESRDPTPASSPSLTVSTTSALRSRSLGSVDETGASPMQRAPSSDSPKVVEFSEGGRPGQTLDEFRSSPDDGTESHGVPMRVGRLSRTTSG